MSVGSKRSKKNKIVKHALIMAAGYGTRLEPLTFAVPKPMVPIVNKPTMQHNLELLSRFGIKNVVCNIHYFPEQIENFFYDGEKFGVSLSYSYEEDLLGTAGGVRKMGREVCRINDTFLVLSSDALTDIDINDLVEYHKSRKAVATIALAKVNDPSQFGVVVLDNKGFVKRFQEKPKKEDALSNLINTGIYVLEAKVLDLIPKDMFYYFGHDIFPRMIEKRKKLLGYKINGYWSDVGGITAYKQANQDVMNGKVKIDIQGKKIKPNIWIDRDTRISKSARMSGSVIIGKHSVVEDGVQLENTVVGDRAVISSNSKIKNSIIWSDSIILSSVYIDDSIIGSWCYIGKEASIQSSVIANRCRLRRAVKIHPGTSMNPGTELL